MVSKFSSTLVALALSATGGTAFFFLNLPLPWLLGSLAVAAATAILGGPWLLPAVLRGPLRPVVGVLAGSAFSADVAASIPGWWDAILIVVAQAAAVTALGFAFFRAVAGFDRQTALFAATPGGVAEMALVGSAQGGSARTIVLCHTLRTIMIVAAVPFIAQLSVGHPIGRIMPIAASLASPVLADWVILFACGAAGYALARLIRFSAGYMVFPMVASAVVHATGLTAAVPPPWLVAMAQIVAGGVVGARFAGIEWREARITLLSAALWAATLIAVAAGSAWAGGWLVGRPFLAMVLALAPAGTVEMTILSVSVGFEVAFVVTCQLCRVMFVLFAAPLVSRLIGAPVQPDGSSP